MFSPLEIIQKKQEQHHQVIKSKILLLCVLFIFVSCSVYWGYFSQFENITLLCTIQHQDQKVTLPISFSESSKWKVPLTIKVEKLRETNITLLVNGKNISNKHSITFENANRKILIHLENYQGTISSLKETIRKQDAEEKILSLAKKIQQDDSLLVDKLTFASLLESVHQSKTSNIDYQRFMDYSTFIVVKILEE